MKAVHYSVLKDEILSYLKPRKAGELMIDCTLGEGGHSEIFLKNFPALSIIGIDADGEIMEVAKKRLDQYSDRIKYYNSWFNLFFKNYPETEKRPDSILLDLGISSYHYEKGRRGFSFKKDEPLDMRLEKSLETCASDIVNSYPEKQLANLFYEYGEEKYSRKIAASIVKSRMETPIDSSKQLENIIWRNVPDSYRYGRIHPATRCFQALRIAVNGELARIEPTLSAALGVLKVGGRIGVISFHSLEDRIVKRFFVKKNKSCTCPPERPMCECGGKPVVKILTKKPVCPETLEVEKNSPSRSAKFRVVEKIIEEGV